MALLINGEKKMWWLELLGTLGAGVGFGLLSYGRLLHGFLLGLLSCCLLIPLFLLNELYFMLTLQAYFAIMNLIGIRRNWK